MSTLPATSVAPTATARLNPLAPVALACSVLAVAGTLWGGFAVLAAFGVGAGHVALQQIRDRGEKGAPLALAGLGIGYAIAAFALASALFFAFTTR